MPGMVYTEITYLKLDVWEWINNFIAHFMVDVITTHDGITVNPC